MVIFLFAVFFYFNYYNNWVLFALLFMTPDLSMIGYLKNKSIGAKAYNLVHNYVLALILLFTALYFGSVFLAQLGLILIAHVGIDRFFGYGLKYSSDFKNTHIQKA